MVGRTVSHYQIISKLGEGGMGEVWEARDTRLDRTVAIKLIPRHLSADPAARTRFVHEAKAASSIEHANICTIHEIDETPEGETFIVMPRYQGELLSDRITRGRVPLEEALHIVEDLAGALAEAHDHDIIHRDVKPANIIVDPHGRPILLDFGLAKLTEHTKVTRTGTTVGTLAYMAPEQAVGKEIDGRADLFSLGVVFYELLTGVRPFSGDHDAAVLYSIVHESAPPLASQDASLPAALQAIVDRALAKDPADRYASLHELETAIEQLRHELQITSATGQRGVDRPRRYRWAIPVALIAVVLVAIVLWKFIPKRGALDADGQAVAVVDFNDLTKSDDPNLAIGMAGLIHVGMVENAPCRVVSPSYLQDIRRRLFGVERGPIEESQALEIARKSGATVLLSGQMGELDGQRYVLWQLVDTESGESVAAKRAEGTRLSALADAVLEGVLPALASRCGVKEAAAAKPVSSLTTANATAYEHYVDGTIARQRHQLDDAIRHFERAVALDTTFALAYFDLAKAHRSRTAYGKARTNTERAWRWRSRLSIQDRMRLEAWREILYYRPNAAMETYRELHRRWPDDRKILEEWSLQLMTWWFERDLLTVTESGMASFPDDPSFVQYHEFALALLGRTQEALAGARDFVKRFPDNPNSWDELGLRFIGAGMPDSAEVAFREAVTRGGADSRMSLAALPYYRGDLETALDSLEGYVRSEGLSADARYNGYMYSFAPLGYAQVLYESGRYRRMLDVVDEAGRLRPDPVDQFYHQRYRYRDYLLRLGRVDEVVRWLDTDVATLASGGGAAADNEQLAGIARWAKLDFRARTLVAMDSLDAGAEAVEALAASASWFGNYARLQALRLGAQIALKKGDGNAALEKLDVLADEAVGDGMFHIEYLEMRAEAYRLAGRFEEAVAVHEDLLKVYGGHALSHYELGLIYEDMKQPAAAAREYRRFLEMWAHADEGLPQLVNARRRLAAL